MIINNYVRLASGYSELDCHKQMDFLVVADKFNKCHSVNVATQKVNVILNYIEKSKSGR